MIFLTVGTQFGFDRLVRALDECLAAGIVDEEIFAQIGPGKYLPRNMRSVASLESDAFDRAIGSCDAVISHAGMGSITMAIDRKKPLLVVPRRKKYGEVVNDHQVDSARRFAQLGHVLVANDTDELAEKVSLLKSFVPTQRSPNRKPLIDRICRHLSSWETTVDTQISQ